jgi:hypothetical protein
MALNLDSGGTKATVAASPTRPNEEIFMRLSFIIPPFRGSFYTILFLVVNSPVLEAADVSFYAVEKAVK